MELERKYGSDKMIVLAGNRKEMACDGRWPIGEDAKRFMERFKKVA